MSDLISDYSTNTQPIEGRPELNVDWNQIYLSERRTLQPHARTPTL